MKKIRIVFITLILAVLLGFCYVYAENQRLDTLIEDTILSLETTAEKSLILMEEKIDKFSTLNMGNEDFAEYISRLSVMSVEETDIEYLDDLVLMGYETGDVLSVFRFCRGTDCDIETVEEVLSLKEKFVGPFWIENAYNYVTDNKYGELDYEDVCQYIEDGYSVDDIEAANALCRRGKYTITEILSKYGEGNTWEQIYNDIENVKGTFFKYGQEKTAADIVEIMQLKCNYGVDESVISALTSSEKIMQYKENCEQLKEEVFNNLIISEIMEEVQ